MKFFVDSADPSEIRACALQGIIHGVSVGASPGALDGPTLVREICQIFRGPVSAAVVGGDQNDEDAMLGLARALARIAPNVVVKLPFTDERLMLVRACASEGIKTNVTRCSSPVQALQAAQAGAAYVSPFGDRVDDIADLDLVRKIVAVYKTYGIATEVLLASVRSASDIVEAALAGAQIATVPFAILRQITEQRP